MIFKSPRRPHRPLQGDGQRLGPLAADEDAGAAGEVEAGAAVAAGVQDALAASAPADAPAAAVAQGAVAHHLDPLHRVEGDRVAEAGDPAEPDAQLARM